MLVAYSLADWIALPKSVKAERQKSNLEAVNIKLSPAQVAELDALNQDWVTFPSWNPVKDHAV